MLALLNHFTATELLAAAEAAEPWPVGRAVCFGVARNGLQFTQYTEALAKADFL